jgi:glycosyltransferase involved in cell wall biosynthesis
MAVIACVIVFNEETMLPGCLESIYDQVDRIVVVDGAYARFPHEAPYSTEATREIARAYGAEWVLCPEDAQGRPRPWATQVAKRNAYLVGEIGDWYLIIDADNRLVGTLPTPEPGYDYAWLSRSRTGRVTWVLRLIEHRPGIRYEGAHNGLRTDAEQINLRTLDPARVVKVDPSVCRYLHLAHLRSAERIEAKRRFYARREPYERPYRRAHGI